MFLLSMPYTYFYSMMSWLHKNRLLRITIPVILPVLRKSKKNLLLLSLFIFLLGFIPSIKAGIESNFINEVNDIITLRTANSYKIFSDILDHKFEKVDRTNNVEDFFENIPHYLTSGNTVRTIIFIYLFAMAFSFFIEYANTKIKASLSKKLFIRIRETAFKKILILKPSEMPKMMNSSGTYSSSIQAGTSNIINAYEFIIDSVQYLFLLITSMFILFSKAWIFGIVFLVAIALQFLISYLRAKNFKSDRESLDKQRNKLVGQAEDILSKKEIILAFEQESNYGLKIKELSLHYGELVRRLDVRGYIYTGISNLINDIERFIIPLSALIYFIYFDQYAIKNVGGVIFLISLYSRLSEPIRSLLRSYDNIKANEATSNSLLDLLDILEPEIKTPGTIISAEDGPAVIFDNVGFRYDKTKRILNDCSFIIPQGKMTIIVGPSGSGKSSIAKVLLGFWPIENGNVQLMGNDIARYTFEEIRKLSSYISQNDHIVDDTIKDNLNWVDSEHTITDERIMQALVDVKLAKSIEEKDILSVFAKDLSGGGQQKLSLARIFLDQSKLLILDEPLTGLDVYTIRDIMPALKAALKSNDRTVILISHKLSFANSADWVILLNESGRVTEQGKPTDLLQNNQSGFYKLYQAAIQELVIQ